MPRQGQGACTHQGLLLREPGLGCDEAQRRGVRMLVHLAEVIFQDLQLLLSGSYRLFRGHLLLGQGYGARHCGEGPVSLPKPAVAGGATLAEPQICLPHPHQLPLPVVSGHIRAQLPSQKHARKLSQEPQPPSSSCLSFPTVATACQQHPAGLSHHLSLTGNCSLSPAQLSPVAVFIARLPWGRFLFTAIFRPGRSLGVMSQQQAC